MSTAQPEIPSVGSKIDAILAVLSGASNREIETILKAVAATKNLRVVSAERSFTAPPVPKAARAAKNTKAGTPAKGASWKTPEYRDLETRHSGLLKSLKDSAGTPAEAANAVLLHEHEAVMKTIRDRLKNGFAAPSGGLAAAPVSGAATAADA